MSHDFPHIDELLKRIQTPKRRALSMRFPLLAPAILQTRQCVRRTCWAADRSISRKKQTALLPYILARHQSVLRRKLGDSDPRLQEQKVTNLRIAAEALSGLLIAPGETFSFWYTVGKPTAKRGYVGGMLLSNGRVIEGIGGGLCQMSNLIYWLLLHGPFRTVEHHHHSMDVFPDSGRTLPFGSGATIVYPIADLRMKNTSDDTLQLEIWLTDTHLKGRLRSCQPSRQRVHIAEYDHCFILHDRGIFRSNRLMREQVHADGTEHSAHLHTNLSPVLYAVDIGELQKKGVPVLDRRTR